MIIGTTVVGQNRAGDTGTIVGRDYSRDLVWVRWEVDGRLTMEDPEDLKIVADLPIDAV